jgi:Spy/CpxP family protein refolding chaperone
MKHRVYVACALLLFVAVAALAQQPPQPPPQPQPDPIGENLFPPELVMQYQQAISLSEEQRNTIKSEIQKAQPRFTDLQWQLQSEAETMASLLKSPKADEQQVLAQLDKILALEREMKRTQFTLVVRIKNSLTPEQQARLRELKNRQRPQPQQ